MNSTNFRPEANANAANTLGKAANPTPVHAHSRDSLTVQGQKSMLSLHSSRLGHLCDIFLTCHSFCPHLSLSPTYYSPVYISIPAFGTLFAVSCFIVSS